MRVWLVIRTVLAAVAAAATPSAAQDSPLAVIVSRYGGEQKLAQAATVFKEGRRCDSISECQTFRSYRDGQSRARVEESFAPPLSRISIVRSNEGFEYYDGPWWKRAWFWAGGVTDGPMDRMAISGAQLDFQDELFVFLTNAAASTIVHEGKSPTRYGKLAETFAQHFPDRKSTVRFFFDSETLLCLQRTITRHKDTQPFSYITYADYRDVSGLPYPFKTELWGDRGKVKIRDEVLSTVQIGMPLHHKLFTAKPNDPLWLFPLEALGLIVGFFVIFFWVRRARARTPKSEAGTNPSY